MFLTVIVFLLTLLVLVISHELGHFLMAKKFGVKVLEFGFGLPPRIFGKRFGETLYSLNALPIGGFVRLLGEDEADVKVRDNERSFAAKPVVQRILMVSAGVTVNLILAWSLFYIVLFNQDFKIQYPSPDPVAMISLVQPGMPAQAAGIKEGEVVSKINNQPISDIESAISVIKLHPNQPLEFTVTDLDHTYQRVVEVTPKEDPPGQGKIGVGFSAIPLRSYNTPTQRIFAAPLYSWDITVLTFKGFGKLISDLGARHFAQASQSVAGPIGLAVITNNIVSAGPSATIFYLWFVGVLSLTLTIINSLPFPALDGGRVAFMIYELLTGQKPNPDFERWVHTVGMVILIILMVLVTASDIQKFLL